MLKAIKKFIIVVIIALITMLVIGALAYRFYFAPKVERYLTETVQSALAKAFQREVTIGAIRLNFPNPQITITDVAIARTQKLAEGTLLSVKTLTAKVLLRTLLAKQIRIDDILVDTPDIWIEFDAQGRSNLPSFGGTSPKEEPTPPGRFQPEKLVERLAFPHIRLRDAQIHFVHRQIPLAVDVARLNLTLSLALQGLRAQGAIALEGGVVEFQNRGQMAVALSGDLQFANPNLTLTGVALQVNRSNFEINGTLADLGHPNLNLAVKMQLALEELDRFLRINQHLTGLVAFDGTVTGTIPDVTAAGHLTCPAGTAWKLDFANMSIDASYHRKQVRVEKLDVAMFDGRITGNGNLSFAGTPNYQADLVVEGLNIKNANRFVANPLPLTGYISGQVEANAASFDFKDLALHTELTLRDIDAYQVKVPRGQAEGDIRNKTLSLNALQADVFQGKVAGSGRMVLSANPDYQATLAVEKAQLEPIMALLPQKPAVSGQISGKITARGAKFDLASLAIEANLAAVNVEAYRVKAKTLNTTAQIKNGTLTLPKFAAQLFDGEVAGQGMIVLAGQTRPKFDVRAALQNISAQSVLRQFAPEANTPDLAFDGRIAGDAAFTGNSFRLADITGTVALTGKGGVDRPGQAMPFHLAVKSSLRDNLVEVAAFDLDSAPLKLTAAGTLNIATLEPKLRYEIASKDLQTLLKPILTFIPSVKADSPLYRFTGKLEQLRGTVQGPMANLQIQAAAHVTQTDLVWGAADDLTAEVTYQANALQITRCRAIRNSAAVDVTGTIDLRVPAAPRLDLAVALKSGRLADYLALVKQPYPADGTLAALRATLTGPVDDLRTDEMALEVSRGTAWGQSFDKLTGNVALAAKRVQLTAITLKKNGGTVSLEGFVGFDLTFRAALRATDVNFHDLDAFENIAVQYEGRADLTFEAEGTVQAPRGKGAIRFKNLVYTGKPVEDITCEIVIAEHTLQARIAAFQQKFTAAVELALTAELAYRAEITAAGAAVEYILSFVTKLEGISGVISGTITSEGSLQKLRQASAKIKLSELQLDVFGQQLKNSKEIDVVVTPQKLTVNSLELKGKELGVFARGFLDFQGNFDLDLDGILDLRPILVFLPRTAGVNALAGRVQLICNVRGTFEHPEIEGLAELNDGGIQLAAYPDPAKNLRGKLAFAKGQVEIIELQGEVGKGAFTAAGVVKYHGVTLDDFNVTVDGKNIFVHDLVEALTLTISPRLQITGNLKRQKVTGDVVIHDALYRKELDLQALVFGKSRTVTLPPLTAAQEDREIELELSVTTLKNVIQIRNKLAELDLRANLHIQGTVAKPQLEGRVEITQGKAQFGDIKYQIVSGILNFTNPQQINPEMNIQVETVVQAYKIALNIEGNLDRFNLDLRSEPELSKGEITRLLAAGSSGGANGYNLVANPIKTLVEGQIEKAVQLDQFTVDVNPLLSKSGGDASPTVTLGKRLFEDLLLTFTTTVGGAEKAQLVGVEYQFSNNIALTVTRNEKGEIDTSFTFKFKIK